MEGVQRGEMRTIVFVVLLVALTGVVVTGSRCCCDNTLTVEDLSGNRGNISLDTDYSEITGYNYTSAPVFALANGHTGQWKAIALANDAVAPTQIQTEQGSYLLRPIDYPKSQIIYNQDRWKALSQDITFFPSHQQGSKLVANDTVTNSQAGVAVDLSADGNVLLVGNPSQTGSGGVSIFTRTGGTWTQFGPQITPPDANPGSLCGESVSISADASRISFGGIDPFNITGKGGSWIYVLSGGSYVYETRIIAPDESGTGVTEGTAVDFDASATRLAIGGSTDGGGIGSTWIYLRSGTTWNEEAKLIGSPSTSNDQQGYAVSMSSDGLTVVSGAPFSGTGGAFVFVRIGTAWTQQGGKLVGSSAVGTSYQGFSVSISGNGKTIASGGYGDSSFVGAVWLFVRDANGVWSQQSKLVPTGYIGSKPGFGLGVALSKTGDYLSVGGAGDDGGILGFASKGAIWVFLRNEGVWSQQSKLLGTGGSAGAVLLGYSVATDADGTTTAAGAIGDSSFRGAAFVKSISPTPGCSNQGMLMSPLNDSALLKERLRAK